jgi:hypothetical protein
MTTTGRTAAGAVLRAVADPAVPADAVAGAVDGAASWPSKAGYHQTTKKAAARPTTTALSKKVANMRVCFNRCPCRLKPAPICV